MNKSHLYLFLGVAALTGCASPSAKYLDIPRRHSLDIANGKREGTTVVVSKPNGVSIYNEYTDGNHTAVEGYAKCDSKRNFTYYRTQDGKLISAAFPYVSELPAQPKKEEETVIVAPATKEEPAQIPESSKEDTAVAPAPETNDNPTTTAESKEDKDKKTLPKPVIVQKPALYRTTITTRLTIGYDQNVRQE